MVERATGAIRRTIPCRLAGFRFSFNMRVSGPKDRAYANIVRDSGWEVWGVVYLCNPSAMKKLDRYEGVSGGHYKRLNVEVITSTGERIKALTYVAGADRIVYDARRTREYL